MATVPAPNSRSYGPEYGLEATRRLQAGFSIVYSENDSDDAIIREEPNGRRFLVRVEPDNSITNLRELPPRD